MRTINTIIRSVELHKEHLLKLIKQKECPFKTGDFVSSIYNPGQRMTVNKMFFSKNANDWLIQTVHFDDPWELNIIVNEYISCMLKLLPPLNINKLPKPRVR